MQACLQSPRWLRGHRLQELGASSCDDSLERCANSKTAGYRYLETCRSLSGDLELWKQAFHRIYATCAVNQRNSCLQDLYVPTSSCGTFVGVSGSWLSADVSTRHAAATSVKSFGMEVMNKLVGSAGYNQSSCFCSRCGCIRCLSCMYILRPCPHSFDKVITSQLTEF